MAEDKQKSESGKKKPAAKKPSAAKKKTSAKTGEKKPATAAPAAKEAPKKATAPAAKRTPSGKIVKVTQIASPAGRQGYQRATLIGLGLNKMHRSRELQDTPAVRGMINSVRHLIKVEDAA